MKHLLFYLFCLSGVLAVQAQTDNMVLQFDFSQVSGSTVTDARYSQLNAKLMNGAKVEQMGRYSVLNLGTASGYLDLTSSAGDIVQGLADFSVSVYYRVDKDASLSGNGYFLWAFSTSSACTGTSGVYSAYRLNAQRFATSPGGYTREVGGEIGSVSGQDAWVHVAYTQSGTTGTLYINGEKKVSKSGMPLLKDVFTSSPAYNWVGRAPFTGDNYLRGTLVSDFRVYSSALSADEIASLARETESLDYEYRYGTAGDFSKLDAAVKNARSFLDGENLLQYPPSALMEFMDAINVAESVLAEGKVNQDLIDGYATGLQTAKAKFSKTKGFVFDLTDAATHAYSTDKGFKHPGGLHTEADFERIRRQLAEGNPTVTAAYRVLRDAAYSQSGCATFPSEAIVRGGTGENYINAARGAAIAYQNALRWKIEGSKAHADNAVKVLMAWCNATKFVTGTSDQCLARGLYGYEFAQAAELMRDYEGWSREDFAKFQQWMLDVWYPGCIHFLRVRNGTWENPDKWWQAPGHYWSNWGLCNALAVISIGVLCDDVFIYNQGMSFIKYDQVGTFTDPRTADPILNDGLTEFWGNLVVTTTESELETGAYGKLGQTNESGRDTGHAAMALGLAVDIAHQGWNQGDDLFAYMDHRIAAGIEYVAAQTQNVEGLPWTNYHYANNGFYYTDSRSWLMTGPALGAQMRPYWGTVIGHYEGVKGVKMPFSKMAYNQMGIDAGGQGGTSGGYDHLGYSVLMNHRDSLAPTWLVPTELKGQVTYDGKTVRHNELGGLVNTYQVTPARSRALAKGTVVTLSPLLPEGEEDTGLWQWQSGETTREITVTADESHIYRVFYTNTNGVQSELCFAIAVMGDCRPSRMSAAIENQGVVVGDTVAQVFYGTEVKLSVSDVAGFSTCQWDNGQTSWQIDIPQITTSRDVQCYILSQGGRKQVVTFHLTVTSIRPDASVGGKTQEDSRTLVVNAGDSVVLSPYVPSTRSYGTWTWDDGSTERTFTIPSADTSQTHTVGYTIDGETTWYTYQVFVKETADRMVEKGNYLIHHRYTDTYLTNNGDSVSFAPATGGVNQIWYVESSSQPRYNIYSMVDSLLLKVDGAMYKMKTRPHRITFASGTDYCTFYNTNGAYWYLDDNGKLILGSKKTLDDYPFELIPVAALRGDLDADGELTVNDITLLISFYLQADDTRPTQDADLDGDGQISVADITILIALYLKP